MDDSLAEGSSGWCDGCYNESGGAHWSGLSIFSRWELVVVTTVCVALLVLGLTGNILTILVVWLRPQMRSTTYLYLSSMAVSDIMMLTLMPLDLYKVRRCRPRCDPPVRYHANLCVYACMCACVCFYSYGGTAPGC